MNKKTKAALERALTARDLQILELIQKQGFATRQQLFESFWKGKKSCNAHHRRIRRLKELKVLEPILGDLGALGLRLTGLGYAVLKDYGLFDEASQTRFQRTYTTQFGHDCKVNQLMSTLSEIYSVMEVTHERELRKVLWSKEDYKKTPEARVHFPDGMIVFKHKNSYLKIAIEVEKSRKSEKRYHQILCKHALSKVYDGVIYFHNDRRQIDRLIKFEKQAHRFNFELKHCKRPNWIYHTMLEEFLAAPLETKIFKENHQWDFRGNSKKLPIRENLEHTA